MSKIKTKRPPARLGKEIKISPKTLVTFDPPMTQEHFVDTASVIIGIGKDNYAELRMDVEAWEALNKGAEIHIETAKNYKKLIK